MNCSVTKVPSSGILIFNNENNSKGSFNRGYASRSIHFKNRLAIREF